MTDMAEHNRLLAIVSAGSCVLLGVVLASSLFAMPDDFLKTIDSVPIKLALLATTETLLVFLAVSIFTTFYQPPPWRMWLRVLQLTTFLGTIITLAPSSLFALEHFDLQISGSQNTALVSITWQSAVGHSFLGFAMTTIMMFFGAYCYSRECRLLTRPI